MQRTRCLCSVNGTVLYAARIRSLYGEFGFCIVNQTEETFCVYARNVLGKFIGSEIFRVCRNICSHVDSNFSCGWIAADVPLCEKLRREGKSTCCLSSRTCF